MYILPTRKLFPIGLLGLLIVYIYTKWVTHNPFICLIAPGLSFGILMVFGTHFVLTGHYSWIAFLTSLIPFFLVNNFLLLNQFPDVDADKTVGEDIILLQLVEKRVHTSLLLS